MFLKNGKLLDKDIKLPVLVWMTYGTFAQIAYAVRFKFRLLPDAVFVPVTLHCVDPAGIDEWTCIEAASASLPEGTPVV